jgi:hypothetical protein
VSIDLLSLMALTTCSLHGGRRRGEPEALEELARTWTLGPEQPRRTRIVSQDLPDKATGQTSTPMRLSDNDHGEIPIRQAVGYATSETDYVRPIHCDDRAGVRNEVLKPRRIPNAVRPAISREERTDRGQLGRKRGTDFHET